MTSSKPDVTRVARRHHTVSQKNISANALKVMSRLHSKGFQVFLVGGAVRDLLLHGHPKDFDVATDATPEEVRALFRNSLLIGRRFRIAHVRFGREIIEVTTFRGHHDKGGEVAAQAKQARRSDSGMLLRDNVFGSLEEDAVRRDFTVNALYYCSASRTIHDYVGGLADLSQGQIRIIGEAEQRYREDPVRMLRAVRFAAKLDFAIATDTAAAIPPLAQLLADVSPARLFDELLKLFMTGRALKTFTLLREYSLLQYLFPATAETLPVIATSLPLIEAAMRSTDERIAVDKPVSPAFVLAALLWAPLRHRAAQLQETGTRELRAMLEAGEEIISAQLPHITLPRRFTRVVHEIWELQLRLQNRSERRVPVLLGRKRFRAAYDFLLLREQAGEPLDQLGDYWTDMQKQYPDAMAPRTDRASRRRWRRPARQGRRQKDTAQEPQ